ESDAGSGEGCRARSKGGYQVRDIDRSNSGGEVPSGGGAERRFIGVAGVICQGSARSARSPAPTQHAMRHGGIAAAGGSEAGGNPRSPGGGTGGPRSPAAAQGAGRVGGVAA